MLNCWCITWPVGFKRLILTCLWRHSETLVVTSPRLMCDAEHVCIFIYLFRHVFFLKCSFRVFSRAVRLYADQWIIMLKGCRRKWSLPNLRCSVDICREGLTKPRKTSDQHISWPRFEPWTRCRRLAAFFCMVECRNMAGLSIVLQCFFFLYGRVQEHGWTISSPSVFLLSVW